jgi:ankyrin repeat protein
MPNKKKERKNRANKKKAAVGTIPSSLVVGQTAKADRRLAILEHQIHAAIGQDNVERVRELLSPPRLGVVVTDRLIHTVLMLQIEHARFHPPVYRLLVQSMSTNLIQDIKSGKQDSPLFRAVRIGNVKGMKHLVNNFGEVFCIHQLYLGSPLLLHAATAANQSLVVCREMCRFLVKIGADLNQTNHSNYPLLYDAVLCNRAAAARLYLELGADPNLGHRSVGRTSETFPIDIALTCGNTAMLSLLLLHGAVIRSVSLFAHLIQIEQHTRGTKLEACRVVLTLHKGDRDGSNNNNHNNNAYIIVECLQFAILENDQESCTILFDALFEYDKAPTFLTTAMYHAITLGNESICQWLVQKYQVEPFVLVHDEELDDSPFLVAARQNQIAILDYFLDLWDAQFEPTRYRNGNGDTPEVLLLRDPLGSLQAFIHVAERYYFKSTVTRLTRSFEDAHIGDDN